MQITPVLINWVSNSIAVLPVVLGALGVLSLCIFGFIWRANQLNLNAEHKLLDSLFWYTPTDVQGFFNYIDAEGRKLYALTQVTLDVMFPIAYGALFAALIVRLYSASLAQRLLILPLGAAVADLGENFTTAYLAWSFTGSQSPLTWLALVFTLIKFALFIASLILILIGGVRKAIGLSS